MKRSELTNQQKLLVPCPICAAAIGVHCQMYSGLRRRNEPHAERKYQAVQAIEEDYDSRVRQPAVASFVPQSKENPTSLEKGFHLSSS
jgi:hypothetical protein